MNLEDRKMISSEDFISIILEYRRNDTFIKEFEGYPINIIDDKYGVIYIPASMTDIPFVRENRYSIVPKLYGLLDTVSLSEMGVTRVRNIPNLNLLGEGVLLGFVDTGIDYTNPAFRDPEGNTRIVSIWDQTIENDNADESHFYYGSVYNKEEINEALLSDDHLSIVPSTDEIGHGTMQAGIAGGTGNEENNFQGVVPLSEFVVVKLKGAKQVNKDFFFVPNNVPCYQQDDIMFGIKYMLDLARSLNRPIVICIGVGTTQGAHDGRGILEDFISYTGTFVGRAFITAAGNEGNSGGHYYGVINRSLGYNEIELLVGDEERGFSMELWGHAPNTYSIDITSPTGQYVPQIVGRLGEGRRIDFLFENTTVYVNHLIIEAQTANPFILIRFSNPARGTWRFRVYARGSDQIDFNIWLPLRGFISPETYFINSNPYTTIVSPGNATRNTTVTAYDASTGSIYINSSRGYNDLGLIVPSFAAPGVNVLSPAPNNEYVRVSGTSVAAAHTTGLAAMMFEWGIIKGNYQTMSSRQIERFLINGVNTDPSLTYPNKTWGYGKVNIFNTLRLF